MVVTCLAETGATSTEADTMKERATEAAALAVLLSLEVSSTSFDAWFNFFGCLGGVREVRRRDFLFYFWLSVKSVLGVVEVRKRVSFSLDGFTRRLGVFGLSSRRRVS